MTSWSEKRRLPSRGGPCLVFSHHTAALSTACWGNSTLWGQQTPLLCLSPTPLSDVPAACSQGAQCASCWGPGPLHSVCSRVSPWPGCPPRGGRPGLLPHLVQPWSLPSCSPSWVSRFLFTGWKAEKGRKTTGGSCSSGETLVHDCCRPAAPAAVTAQPGAALPMVPLLSSPLPPLALCPQPHPAPCPALGQATSPCQAPSPGLVHLASPRPLALVPGRCYLRAQPDALRKTTSRPSAPCGWAPIRSAAPGAPSH